jgi:nicotinamide mononucleotide adenylyltransferase
MSTRHVAEGSVHGRFQPLHVEHLEYILEAKKRCDFLWIGITKYEISQLGLNPLGRHRERPEANPLSYYERIVIIRQALADSGLSMDSFGFVPFPIESPPLLAEYIPTHVHCFTTICEEWNREKIRVLEAAGYTVEVLWERDKKLSASIVRELIALGDDRWKEMVPPASVAGVERFGLAARLRARA